jgi:hypothetical protein
MVLRREALWRGWRAADLFPVYVERVVMKYYS